MNLDEQVPSEEDYEERTTHSTIRIIGDTITACVEALKVAFAPDPHYTTSNNTGELQDWMNEKNFIELPFTIAIFNAKAVI